MVIELPWPPSINHYWRRKGNRYFVSPEGKYFRNTVYYICSKYKGFFNSSQRLSLFIEAYPPDKRKRDLDNLFKATLDSLQYAEIFSDDSQIDYLAINRNSTLKNKIIVKISIIQNGISSPSIE